MTDINATMPKAPVLKSYADFSPEEVSTFDAFMWWLEGIKTTASQASAECLGMNARDHWVKLWLLTDGIENWMQHDPEGLLARMDDAPAFPNIWPAKGPDLQEARTLVASLSDLKPLPGFPKERLPQMARALRQQAILLLKSAEEIEDEIIERQVEERIEVQTAS